MKYGIFALAVGLAAAVVVHAQDGDGARANQAPNTLGQPLLERPDHVREDAFIRVPLRPEDRKYGGIDGGRLKQFLMEVDAISLRDRATGNLFWGRNVGTAGHEATQTWAENHFKRNGLANVHRQPLDLGPQWSPTSYSFTFTAGGKTFTLPSARPAQGAVSTPPGGLDLELMWLGIGSSADFAGRDVKGKAVLIQDIPLPGDLRHSAQLDGVVRRAFEKGAAAVGIVFGISDNFAIWQRIAGGPGFNVGFEDSRMLRDLIGAGQPVRVKYQLQSEMKTGLKTAHVWGTLPGTTDEDITIIAHMDGFFQSSLDNASGLAVMMGLVEHFAKVPQAERRRNIRFMASAGHHGGPGARYLHDNKETALAKTALAINLEHVAAVRTKYWGYELRKTNAVSPMRWWVWGSPALLDVALNSFGRFNVAITADMDTGASGEMGSLDRDVPTMHVITSPEIKHTEQDTPEWVPAVGLEQITRAYSRIIDEVNKLDRAKLQPLPAKGTN